MMGRKHAFLIMAHHNINHLKRLVSCLDDERFDIFVHIDKKCHESISALSTQNANLYIIDSMDVRWAGYTQIECEIALLEYAINKNIYKYYHLLTGASFPIKSNDYICDFFEKNNNYEFIGFDNQRDYSDRVKYYYLFNEMGKAKNWFDEQKRSLRWKFISLQKKINIDRTKGYDLVFKKGIAYWSITHECAVYIVSNKKLVETLFKHSFCGDEVFAHTLVYNSEFKNKVYSLNDEFEGSLRLMPWHTSIGERDGHNFVLSDFDDIKKTSALFALKFEGKDGLTLIDRIERELLTCK